VYRSAAILIILNAVSRYLVAQPNNTLLRNMSTTLPACM